MLSDGVFSVYRDADGIGRSVLSAVTALRKEPQNPNKCSDDVSVCRSDTVTLLTRQVHLPA
jgi:hypothetical protein